MLSSSEIQRISAQIIEDIQREQLSNNKICERIYFYLEHIPGFECVSEETLQKTVETVLSTLPNPSRTAVS